MRIWKWFLGLFSKNASKKALDEQQSPTAAAKRRLAEKQITADFERYPSIPADPKMIAVFVAENPEFAEALANFHASLKLLKMPDDGTKH
jgi:hypothetical protein